MSFKVDIKKWHAVGVWSWEAGDDMCGICRNPFDGCPPESKFPGDDSPVVWGKCGHAFHLQVGKKPQGNLVIRKQQLHTRLSKGNAIL